MRSFVSSVVILSVALAAPARAQTVVDFEGLPDPGYPVAIPTGYAGLDWGSGWNYWTTIRDYYLPHSGGVVAYAHSPVSTFGLSSPTVFQGAFLSGPTDRSPSAFFRLFLGDALVHTSGDVAFGPTPLFIGSGYSGLVDRVEIVNSQPYFWVVDDLTFGTTVTPEPVSMVLLGSGLAGLGAAARRRRKREEVAPG